MTEEYIQKEGNKIPTPLLLIYLVLAPLLANILSNPNIDKNIGLWSAILIIGIMGLLGLLHFYIDDRENQRVHDQRKILLENRKMELDHEIQLKNIELKQLEFSREKGDQVMPLMREFMNMYIEQPEKFQKFIDMTKKKEVEKKL